MPGENVFLQDICTITVECSNSNEKKSHLVVNKIAQSILITIVLVLKLHTRNFAKILSPSGFYSTQLSGMQVDLPPPDLSPSQVVNETLQLLKDVLASHDSAITPLNERRQDYEKVVLFCCFFVCCFFVFLLFQCFIFVLFFVVVVVLFV